MKHIILIILLTLGVWADNSTLSKKQTIPYVVDDYVTIATIGEKHIAVYKNNFNSLSIVDIMAQKEIAKIEHPFKNELVEHIRDANDTQAKRIDFTNSDGEIFDGVLIDPVSKLLFIFRFNLENDKNVSIVKAFDVLSGKEVWARNADWPIRRMAVYKDKLLLGDAQGNINLWSIDKPRQLKVISSLKKEVRTLVVFEKDNLFVSQNSFDEKGKIYDLKNNCELQGSDVFKDSHRRGNLDFAYHDNTLYATSLVTTVYAGSIRDNSPAIEIGKFDKWVASRVDTTAKGSYILSRSADTIKVWESKTYHEIYNYTREPFNRNGDYRIGTFIDYQILNDTELLVGTCKEGLLFKYNLVTKATELFTAKNQHCIQRFILDPNGKYVFTIDVEGGITTWDLATKQEVAYYKLQKNEKN